MAYTSPSVPASGLSFAAMASTGASGHLKLLAAGIAATAAPGNPTVSATGGGASGGSLAAGTYYVEVTETNGIGETTPNATEQSVTIASGNIPRVTFAALQSGNLARNVYVGTAAGAEVCYARGITAGTYDLSAAIPTNSYAVPVPTANSTGLTWVDAAGVTHNEKLQALRAAADGRIDAVYRDFARAYGEFARGEPAAIPDVISSIRRLDLVGAALQKLAAEAGALVEANPGHFATMTTGIGLQKTKRLWP